MLIFKALAVIICATHEGGSGVFELHAFHSGLCFAAMKEGVRTLMLYLQEMD